MSATLRDPWDVFVFVVYIGFEPNFINIRTVFRSYGKAVQWCTQQVEHHHGPVPVPERGYLDNAPRTEISTLTDNSTSQEARVLFTIERCTYGRLSAGLHARLGCSKSFLESIHVVADKNDLGVLQLCTTQKEAGAFARSANSGYTQNAVVGCIEFVE
ncbi:MAG: hypothetical protein Q9213_007102 [Squamulea squamosa]